MGCVGNALNGYLNGGDAEVDCDDQHDRVAGDCATGLRSNQYDVFDCVAALIDDEFDDCYCCWYLVVCFDDVGQ